MRSHHLLRFIRGRVTILSNWKGNTRVLTYSIFALLLSAAILFTPGASFAAIGWIGNMYPAGGSSNTIIASGTFDVYVQVWKDGVTNFPGQGAGISCALHWASVPGFGGTWGTPTDTAMTYNTDVGNNDEYKASISPTAGLYEFTAYCTDGAASWQGDGNGKLAVNSPSVKPTGARALWLDSTTLAWNGTTGSSYKLLYDADGAIDTTAAGATTCDFSTPPTGPCYVALTADGTVSGYSKNPNATGKIKLTNTLSDADAKHLLKGQVVVASYGSSTDVSRVQIQSVLDALYAANAKTQTLGVTYSGGVPSVSVWAPTAKSVKVRVFADSSTATYTEHAMTEDAPSGVWSVTGDATWNRQFYLFDVEVYVPAADMVLHNLVTDPYSVSLSQDGEAADDVRSQFVNLNDGDLKPTNWDSLTKPTLLAPEDIVVYETHVRDFSINDATVPANHQGTFMAFTDFASDGMKHLLALKDAGLTVVHLLPAFDIASVIEKKSERVEPSITLSSRDSEAAQAADRSKDGFNWGYDPFHYGVPEGSYSTNPDGVTRIKEFREMVKALNANGLRVVMDVVYNHTAASGQDDKSVLDKVVPGYYYRYDVNGNLQTSSCCSDTACEYEMMEKLMIDTVLRFATDYKVDGFRFDLMNLHTQKNMTNLKAKVDEINTNDSNRKIYLYGEGWDFGSASSKGLTTCPDCYAKQWNMKGTRIGTFNDKIRDAAHGGYSENPLQIRHQGFINGLSYDWNGYEYNGRDQSDLRNAMATLRMTLKGTVDDYTDDPQESINYVEKHDNETLFDQNVFKMPIGASMADRVRAQNMGASLVGLAQGIPFIQMGSEILRSKSLDRNSYDSGDWFNKVDWTYATNNFGVGLPPQRDNEARWDIMKPLLTNTALDPATADMQSTTAHLREILRIRKSSKLFRLETEADINAHVSFYNAGPTPQDGLIVMSLTDGASIDPTYETILVFFNANKIQQTFTIAGASGKNFTLHPIQADTTDEDSVVKTSTFDNATGKFTIPARTTAVFVSTQLMTQPLPPSTIDWVGSMWPRGSAANAVNQGTTTGFDVFVQVYEAGVTEAAGQGAGISCFLHWGKYGTSWQDIAMTFNTQKDNNDEYKATIPASALTATGTYGFTAYCQKSGEDNKWKVDGSDDQGDGLITVIPTVDSSPVADGSVFVHLFEWKWTDIQKECPYLAQKGYKAVQVSPPMEHIVPTADMGGVTTNDFPWWVRYQPVTHDVNKLTSRSGTKAEFQRMITACNAVGVDIYVDAVFNQMAKIEVGGTTTGIGTAGTEYDSDAPTYGTQYTAADFHNNCSISSYSVRSQVQGCRLSTMPDLNTGDPNVQAKIRAYLQGLLAMGVKGFRIDAAKHIAAPEVAAILSGLTLPGGGAPYIFQETIDVGGGEPIRDWEYTPSGDVTEFGYSQAIANAFTPCNSGKLSDLQNLSSSDDMMPSRFAVVFTDNHDNQRGHGAGGSCIVDHRDAVHELANIFVLAYPYGYPSIMSSYYWSSDPATNTGDSLGPPSTTSPYGAGSGAETRLVYVGNVLTNCSASYENGKWVCEHRRASTANMVQFRKMTAGEAMTNWQTISDNHIAFGRGAKGFVAINREAAAAAPTTYTTSMPAGIYCDVIQGEVTSDGKDCTGRKWTVTAEGKIENAELGAMDALAIHAASRTGLLDCSKPIPLTQGVLYSGTTVGAPKVLSNYFPVPGALTNEIGPEKLHQVYVPFAGVFTATLSGVATTTDLDLFVLDQCNPNRTVAAGDISAAFTAATPGVYYIIVDQKAKAPGTTANGGAYKLTVEAPIGYDNWTSWVDGKKAMIGAPTMAADAVANVLYQTVRGSDGYVWTRSTQDGFSWQPWSNAGTVIKVGTASTLITPKTSSTVIAMQPFSVNQGMYQAMRESGTNRVLTRNLAASTTWSADAAPYYKAGGNITMAEFGGTLYQATRAIATTKPKIAANVVLTRSSENGETWNDWGTDSSSFRAAGDITMIVFDNAMYQAARQAGTNAVATRELTGGNWSSWTPDPKKTVGAVTMAVVTFGGKERLYQAIREYGTNKVWTRYKTATDPWTAWEYGQTLTASDVMMQVITVDGQPRLYQAANIGGKAATCYTMNGTNWTPWVKDGAASSAISMATFTVGGAPRLYQAVKGASARVWTRYTTASEVIMTPNPPATSGAETVTVRKGGTGNGIVTVSTWVCPTTCQELQIPVLPGVTFSASATPDAGSTFVGWQTASGELLTGFEYVQPGETVIAVFERQ